MMAKRRKAKSTDPWKFLFSNLVQAEEASESDYIATQFTLPETDKVTSWEELIDIFRSTGLYLTPGNEIAIAVCVAVTLSPYLPGEPIWLFLIGLPSSGKTTVIESFGTSNIYCESQSQLHSTMLVSGCKSADGKDASFLPRLKKRTLLIKDYTTVVSMDSRAQESLYGILRDAFDGTFRKVYGNREERFFTGLKFGMIAGVTRVIHGDSRSSLGERFLKIEYHDDDFDEQQHILAAMRTSAEKEERTRRLERAMLGFVDHLVTNMPDVSQRPVIAEGSEFEFRISQLALLVAHLRAQVDRRGDDSLMYRPGKEIASRLSVQLKQTAEALMLVFGITEPNDLLYDAIRKLALDSCIPFNIEFSQLLHDNPQGLSRGELELELQLPSTNIHRICNDLLQLGIIRMRKSKNGKGSGRDKHVYVLNPAIEALWKYSIKGIPLDVHSESTTPRVTRRKSNNSGEIHTEQGTNVATNPTPAKRYRASKRTVS